MAGGTSDALALACSPAPFCISQMDRVAMEL